MRISLSAGIVEGGAVPWKDDGEEKEERVRDEKEAILGFNTAGVLVGVPPQMAKCPMYFGALRGSLTKSFDLIHDEGCNNEQRATTAAHREGMISFSNHYQAVARLVRKALRHLGHSQHQILQCGIGEGILLLGSSVLEIC